MSVETPDYGDKRFHDLAELDGATLEWVAFIVSFGSLWLGATDLAKGEAALLFSTLYVDCPTTMHDIKMREANAKEIERMMPLFPPDVACGFPGENNDTRLFMIECREGIFSILADAVWMYWAGSDLREFFARPGRSLESLLAKPLWKNGPPFEGL